VGFHEEKKRKSKRIKTAWQDEKIQSCVIPAKAPDLKLGVHRKYFLCRF